MYLDHFGLRELPFTLTPDTSFFFASAPHAEALNTLLVALRIGEGFIKVTGEVGTGKTLLCRQLLSTLGPRFVTAYLPNPMLDAHGLYLAVAEELGVEVRDASTTHRLQRRITERLIELTAAGNRVVLCVDEAQAMPLETLEAVRLLTNLETEKYKLLQVVLFGQPELDQRLDDPAIRQLRQRIAFAYRLQPIDRAALDAYLRHRLTVAGSSADSLFVPGARAALHRASRGIPRLVNILAHKGLLAAFGQGSPVVRRSHMWRAIRDTEQAQAGPNPATSRWPLRVATLVVVGAGMAAWWSIAGG